MSDNVERFSLPRAPYGRHTARSHGTLPDDSLPTKWAESDPTVDQAGAGGTELATNHPYQGPTYYDMAALKPGHYEWLIVSYFFVGGIAGGAQIVACVAEWSGRPEDQVVVRYGRYVALTGAILSPTLLVADLYTPQRFYNMLRIFRRTSAMSVGSWSLAAFGMTSGATAMAQLLEDLGPPQRQAAVRRLGKGIGVLAAASGAMMCFYTGSLLAATSVPLWAGVSRILPALFGASATATAAAALTTVACLGGAKEPVIRRLKHIHTIASSAELAASWVTEHQWSAKQIGRPIQQQPWSTVYKLGAVGLGVVVPLAIHAYQEATGRRTTKTTLAAAASTLAGGFLLRASILFAGRRSAENPRDYFHFTQPR